MGTLSSFSPGLEPAGKKMALATNYMSFTDGTRDFAQQYLPDLYENEIEIYSKRTIKGFLAQVGAEEAMKADQVIWTEQTRLHVAYDDATIDGTDGTQININTTNDVVIKLNQTILVSHATKGAMKVLVIEVNADSIKALPYKAADFVTGTNALFATSDPVKLFVYGSEMPKGSTDDDFSTLEPDFVTHENSPIIIRDRFQINGSDVSQIGWVNVETEDGTGGYLWYLKAKSETKLRYDDYLEMTSIEGQKVHADSAIDAAASIKRKGSEGFFEAIESRGHVMDAFDASGTGTSLLGDFDDILKQLDKEGAIEENMLFADRGLNLAFDDMLAGLNSPFQTGSNLGASFGVFNNSADMALNLGFSGFRRGSYDFYKTDWKYLNDASTRGMVNDIEGVLVPAGTSTVYDQTLGSNIRRPFLHVRYRASEADDRKLKSWVTGSVGGNYTSGLDAMTVHFLSERCLVTQAANNFVLFKK